MIIFLYGPDTYRSRQKLNEIIGQYQSAQKSGANLKYFEGEGLAYKDFENETKQISMFKEKKLLVIKNIFSNKDFKDRFLLFSDGYSQSSDIILFYEERDVKKTDPLFKFLKKAARSQDFSVLDGLRLKNWIGQEFRALGAKIETAALDKLINFIGNDSWQAANEAKKLSSFRKNQAITKKDIGLLVRPKIDLDIFETIDSLAQRNKKRAISLIRGHIGKGDHPLYLLSMINFQFRNLLLVKNLIEKGRPYYSLSKETGLHPFVVKKSFYLCQKFTILELKKIYHKIFQADLDIKTGKMDPETALDLLVTGI